jgi:carbon monoxide dehydrogenase subunit G
VKLQGERLILASPEATWAALNDAEVLKACIAGCRSFERVADSEYLATIAMRLGPVNASFKGNVKLERIVPPVSCTIMFNGNGGIAGFGKGSADVTLSPIEGGTCLNYVAGAQVGGKLAQVGSRIIEGAAAKMADEFFAAFEAKLSPGGALQAEQRGQVPKVTPVRRGQYLFWIAAALILAAIVAYLAAS